MTKKNLTITALAAVLTLSISAMAFAGPGYGRGGCGGPYGGNGAYSQLTPEKQAAVDTIVEKYNKQFDELRTQMWTKHSTLQAMVNGGQADEAKIGKLTKEVTELRDQMFDLRTQMSAELEKETGLTGFGGRGRHHQGFQGGGNAADCPGLQGQGRGHGYHGGGRY